jgi:hypothetical protein
MQSSAPYYSAHREKLAYCVTKLFRAILDFFEYTLDTKNDQCNFEVSHLTGPGPDESYTCKSAYLTEFGRSLAKYVGTYICMYISSEMTLRH